MVFPLSSCHWIVWVAMEMCHKEGVVGWSHLNESANITNEIMYVLYWIVASVKVAVKI